MVQGYDKDACRVGSARHRCHLRQMSSVGDFAGEEPLKQPGSCDAAAIPPAGSATSRHLKMRRIANTRDNGNWPEQGACLDEVK